MNQRKRKKRDSRRHQAQRQSQVSPAVPAEPSKTQRPTVPVTPSRGAARGAILPRPSPKDLLRQRISMLPALVERQVGAAASSLMVDSADLRELSDRVASGVSTTPGETRGALPLDVVLGIDFGTSSTKIVARLPYETNEPSFAIPAVPFAMAEDHPHMWESRIWLTPSGLFSLAPEPGAAVLCSIKTNLMSPGCDHAMVLHSVAGSATALESAAAFLALQIRHARGWLYRNRLAMLGSRPLRWHYNVGLPAAKLDRLEMAKQYQTCLAAAVRLAGMAGPIALDSVRKTIQGISLPDKLLEQMLASLQPEIAAAVAGFARSRKREDGLYVMVDVGAGTLDCCTFSLQNTGEGDRCPIFEANVSLLGMQPLELCQDDKPVLKCFKGEVSESLIAVLRPTMTRRHPGSRRWPEGLPVFVVGGGKPSLVHRSEIDKIHGNLRNGGKGGFNVLDLPSPEDLDHSAREEQLHRLAVAVGLSLPASDMPEVQLPTSIGDVSLLPQRDYERGFINKDMM